MKRGYISFLLVLLVLSLAACQRRESDDFGIVSGYGDIIVSVSVSDCSTKSAETFDYEEAINTLQFLVFDSQGKLLCYSQTPQLEGVPAGNCEVWVVANGPNCSDVMDRSSLMNKEILLSNNSTDPSKGFVMRGSTSVTVLKDDSVPASIVLERMVSRILINNIINSLYLSYGDIILKYVYLANVIGNQNVWGTAEPVIWYNKCGCVGGIEGQEIDGETYLAEIPDMTFRNLNVTIPNQYAENVGVCVYGFENNETLISKDFPFTPRLPRLYFVFSICNPNTNEWEDKRYSIVLDAMSSNLSYDLNFKLTMVPWKDNRIDNDELFEFEITSSMVSGYNTINGSNLNI